MIGGCAFDINQSMIYYVICLQGGEIITNNSKQLQSGESDNQITGNRTHNRHVKGQNFQHRHQFYRMILWGQQIK